MARNLDELLYPENYQLVGAAGPKGLAPLPPGMGGARGVQAIPRQNTRRTPLGVDSGANVAAGATVDIAVSPQVMFRPERFIVSDGIAGDFLIEDIKVGNKSMLPSSDPVPASIFTTNATDVQLAFETAQVGQQIVVRVTNTSAGPLRFSSAFLGSTLET